MCGNRNMVPRGHSSADDMWRPLGSQQIDVGTHVTLRIIEPEKLLHMVTLELLICVLIISDVFIIVLTRRPQHRGTMDKGCADLVATV